MTMELWAKIFEVVILPLLAILTAYIVNFVRVKISALKEQTKDTSLNKYLDMLEDAVVACVTATNQTYVEALKKSGNFTIDAQKEALNRTKEAVIAILSEEAQKALSSAIGDIEVYITQKIEATVNEVKI